MPQNWKKLEQSVAHVLEYCNYDTEIDKKVFIARGKSEIDVYAISRDKYKSLCICECKYWDYFVKQDVVDAFRSRVSDIGANIGIIISKKGFQSGCYEKIKYTNIKLFSFEEFIEFYKIDYLLSRAKEMSKLVIPLCDYSNPSKDFYEYELLKSLKRSSKK